MQRQSEEAVPQPASCVLQGRRTSMILGEPTGAGASLSFEGVFGWHVTVSTIVCQKY